MKLKQIIKSSLIFIAVSFCNLLYSQTTVTYTGMGTITCPANPTATIAPAVAGLSFSQMSRGSGVTCETSTTGITGSAFNATLASALTGSKWFTFSVTSNSNTTFTVSSLSIVSQVSNTGGTPNVSVQYSIDNGAKTAIGSFTPTTTSTAYAITPGSAISVGPGQTFNVFVIPNNLNAAGTTARVNNNTSITLTATSCQSYSTIPYTTSFESAWTQNACSGGTSRLPDAYWGCFIGGTSPSGNNYWHREDYTGTDWTSPAAGAYTPVSSNGSHSARFHNNPAVAGSQGSLDLYLNLSAAGTKLLTFDYISPSTYAAPFSFDVLLSTDGGITFPTTLITETAQTTAWTAKSITFSTTSSTCVIRFRMTDKGTSDVGIDNLSVSTCTPPSILTVTNGSRVGTGSVNLGATASAGTVNWYSAATGGASLASGTSYTTGVISATTTYFVDATNGGCTTASRTSVIASVINYCSNTNATNTAYYISSFSTTGGTTNITNNGTGFSANGYGNYTAMAVTQVQGGTFNFSITETGGTMYFGIWVDWNQDGDFADANEQVYLNNTTYAASASGSFTVPAGATVGSTRMRVAGSYIGAIAACGGTSYSECEDYTFNVTASCTPPTITSHPSSQVTVIGSPVNFTVATSAGSPTYQWQMSSNNATWTNVSNGIPAGVTYTNPTTATLTVSGNAFVSVYYYRCVVTAAACPGYSNSATLSISCNPTSVPWSENFDAIITPNLPSCWNYQDVSPDGYNWLSTTTGTPNSAPNHVVIAYNTAAAANDWLYTPPLALTGGQTYQLSFYYKSGCSSFTENLEVEYGTAASATGSGVSGTMAGGIQIWNLANFANTTYTLVQQNFTPASSGTYFIGFHGYSAADQCGIYLDQVSVVPLCTPPTTQATNFTFTSVANNSMTVNWTRGNGNNVMVVAREGSAVNTDPTNGASYTANAAFGSGSQIGSGNFVVYKGTGTSVNLTNLASGTTYHFAAYEYFTANNCYYTTELTGNRSTTGTYTPGSSCANSTVVTTLPYTATGKSTCGNGNLYTSSNACGSVYMNGEDYLFRYTPLTQDTVKITLSNTGLSTGVFVMNGCPDLPGTTCIASDVNPNGNPLITNLILSAGTTYYILVSTWPTPNCTAFDIAITKILTPRTADCFIADPVCQDTYPYTHPYPGAGNYSELGTATSKGCLTGGEHKTKWFTFTVNTTGNLSFTINSSVDYDWALYNLTNNTCADIISPGLAPVRCNYSATTGNTGCSSAGTLASEGASGSVWCSQLPVTAGQIYSLLIDNYHNDTTGYTLSFTGGDAGIVDNITPALQSISTIPCGATSIDVTINKNVLCSSVTASDFTLTGPGVTAYTITSVSGNGAGCMTTNGYERNFSLMISPPIMESGTFTLALAGSITDVCNHTTSVSTKTFTITGVSATASKTDPSCNNGTNGSISASASGGTPTYQYSINGGTSWQASGTFNSLGPGSYTVLAKDNLGCSGSAIVTLVNPPALNGGTIDAAQTICYNTAPAAFTSSANASGGSGAITYQWQRDAGCTGTWSDIAGATSATFTSGALTQTTCFRRKATDNCTFVYSNSIQVTVNPQSIGGTATAAPASVCYNSSSTISLAGNTGTIQWQSSPNGTVWTNIAGATASTYTTPNLTSTTYYRAVVTSGSGCTSANSSTATVTVYPQIAAASITGYTSPICYNASPGTFTANPSGGTGTNTITWYNSGGTNLGTGATFAPGALSSTTGYYYTVSNTCGLATSSTTTITVHPNATVTATPNGQTICSGATSSIALSSGVAGTTFSWIYSPSSVSGGSSGSGTAISQTLTNSGTSAGTANYQVTPTANGCAGTPVNIVVTVNPIPTLTASPLTQTICSQTATNISLSSNVSGTTLSWTVNHGANVTGGTSQSGIAAPSTLAQTLSNSGTTASTATYYIYPTANSCNGSTATVVISVNPKPTATASNQAICSGQATNISLTSNVAGTSFTWTATPNGVSGSSNCAAACGTSIAQTLTYTGAPGTVLYTVTPTANGCAGNTANVTATVNPLPSITNVTKTDVTICNGSDGSITITAPGATGFSITGGAPFTTGSSPYTFSGLPGGTYTPAVINANSCTVTAANVSITSGSAPPAPVAGTNATYCQGQSMTSLTATAGFGGTITWWTDPSLTTQIGTTTCSPLNTVGTTNYYATETVGICKSAGTMVTITINPRPVATATPASQTICSGGTTGITLSSTVGGTTYAWTASQSGVTGASNSSGNSIAQTLSNGGTSSGTATYYVVPTANSCAGSTTTIVITVNPIPVATPSPSTRTICSGGNSAITLSSGVTGTTFSWYVNQSGVSGASSGSGSAINQTLANSGTTAGTATYYIIPTANSCTGSSVTAVVTVNPIPSATATPSTQTICSGLASNISLTSNVAATNFNWTISQSGVTGAGAGSGTTIAQTLNNSGTTAGTATYYIVPTASSCAGSTITAVVTVNPRPTATTTPSAQTICSNGTTSISLTSNVASTSYSYTVSQTGTISGGVGGTGNSIAQTLTNSGTTAGTATYYIIPTASSCAGSTASVVVTVNPIPNTIATPASQVICSGGATSIALTSGVAGSNFNWTVSNSGGISGSSASSGNSINQTINNSLTTAGTATYYVVPTANACSGSTTTIVITVNPKPNVMATPSSQSICSTNNTSINLTSDVAATSFTWTASQSAGISGASGSTGTTINQTLNNAGSAPGTATYYITPTASSCSGASITVVVTVNPIPSLTATPASQTICSGASSSISLSSAVAGTTFSWTANAPNITGATNANGNSIAQALTNTVFTSQVASYSVTPSANGCNGSTTVIPVTVNPAPNLIATPASQTICSGVATSVSLSSSVAGTSFSWSYTQSGVTGASSGSGTSIAQILTNSGTTAGTATYLVTPSANTCNGVATSITVTVNPRPAVSASPATQAICSGGSTSITLTSPVAGANFAWSFAQTNANGASASSGSNISQALTATGTVPGTVSYYVVATASGCSGATSTVTITVNPIPVVTATPPSQTICSEATTAVSLTSNVASSSFNWTTNQSGTSGASNSSGTSIAQALTATGTTAGTATYYVVPSANSCSGATVSVVITVNPKPVASSTPASQNICSGTSTSLALTSNVAGTTFGWAYTANGVTGATSGSGTNIAQTLTYSLSPGTLNYSVTPSANGCTGTVISIPITVYQLPTINTTDKVDVTLCGGNNGAITINATGATGFSITGGAPFISNGGIFTGLTSGIYTPAIQNANGCIVVGSNISINAGGAPPAPAATASATYCQGVSMASLTATPGSGGTIQWWSDPSLTTQIGTNTCTPLNIVGTTSYYATETVGGCKSAGTVRTITINPIPVASATPAAQTLCSGTSSSIGLSSTVTGTSFNWTVSQSGVSGATANSGSAINQTISTTGATAGTATYYITPSANSCSGSTISVVITINPIPNVTVNPSSQTLCSGNSTSLNLSSNVGSAAFNWTVVQAGVSGAASGTGNLISQQLTNSGVTQGTATYYIVPTANSCSGSTVSTIVSVNPIPAATTTPATQTICSETATNIALTSNVASTNFNWTINQVGVSGGGTGSGNSINQTLTNSGTTPGTATYYVTPSANGCSGATATVVVTVNPLPSVTATPSSQSICSGTTSSVNLGSAVAGTSFSWTVTATGVTGASNSSGSIISQTLSNAGTTAGTATYNVVPVANGCTGNAINIVVTVNPIPNATANPASQTICSNNQASINLSSNVIGASFTWTGSNGTNISGATGGSGTNITQTLQNTGSVAGDATYVITPSANTCIGNSITATVTVSPRPTVTANPAIASICSGSTTSVLLSSNVTNTQFSWTVAQTGVSGASPSSGNSIDQVLSCTGTIPGTAIYTITPTANTCSGTATDVTITVNPIPVISINPNSQIICSGSPTNISLTSNVTNTNFNWTVSAPNISGASAGSGSSIIQTLTNNVTSTQFANYSITPVANSCNGTAGLIQVTVNPTPNVTVTPSSQVICSGDQTNLSLTSAVANTTFSWTYSSSSITGAANGAGNTIAQALNNSGTVADNVTYTITPSANSCNGQSTTAIVTVNPIPNIVTTPSSQSICSGGNTSISLSSGISNTAFSWTVAQSGVVGASDGNGILIAQTLTNSNAVAGTATYSITPSANNCSGTAATVIITVNPIPNVTATPSLQSICSGAITNIALSSNVSGATYTWTISNSSANVNGSSAGNGSLIGQTLNNTGTINETVTYQITPHASSCDGQPTNAVVTVYPIPTVTAIPANQTICSGETTNISLSSPVSGTTFDWTVNAPGVGGASASSGNAISQTLTNSGISSLTATYSVTPHANSCNGTNTNILVQINPIPNVFATPAGQTICSANQTSITLSSQVAGTDFSWSVFQSGVSGATSSTGTTISQNLTNTGNIQGNAVYTITPIAASCTGSDITVTILVNPTPNVIATPASQTICSNENASIQLSSDVSGTSFNWTINQAGTSGANVGLGTQIADLLTSINGGTATYNITPSAAGCLGNVTPVVITVNPLPVITNATSTDVTICGLNNGTINIAATGFNPLSYSIDGGSSFNANSNFSSLAPGSYPVVVSNGYNCNAIGSTLVIGTNGAPLPTFAGTDATYCDGETAVNLTATASNGGVLSWYFNSNLIGTGASINPNSFLSIGNNTFFVTETTTCEGAGLPVVITVNPRPVATATPNAQAICSGGTAGILLSSSINGTTFDWTVSQTGGVINATDGNGSSISQMLSNPGIASGTATYQITPTVNNCTGQTINAVVTVNPIPVATASPNTQTICSGTSTSITLASLVIGTNFSWTVSATGISGASNGSGNTIGQTLSNFSSTSPVSAYYTVVPTANSCTGNTRTVVVTVNPVPDVTPTPSSQTICSNQTTSIALSSSVAGTTFSWTSTAPNGISGNSNSSGTSISETLINSNTTQGTVNYSVIPAAFGCNGGISTIPVIVKPTPVITANPATETICSGGQTSISLSSGGIAGTQFNYTANASSINVSGYSAGNTPQIIQTITNSDASSASVTYTVNATANGCVATPIDVVVNIISSPDVTATPPTASICSGATTNISLTSTVSGINFNWTVPSNPNGASNGSGNSISQTLTNNNLSAINLTYAITPSVNGCLGQTIYVPVSVKPIPALTISALSTELCSNEQTNINLYSTINPTTFTWTATETNASGASNSGGNAIYDVLNATANSTGTVLYNITPTANGCAGTAGQITINVNPRPNITANPATVSICSGENVVIALQSDLSNTNFSWTANAPGTLTGATSGAGNDTINNTLVHSQSNNISAQYNVTPVVGSCTGTSIIIPVTVFPQPVINAGTDQSITYGSAANLTATGSQWSGLVYNWQPQDSISGSNNGLLAITNNLTSTTTFTITTSDNNTGCTASDSVIINVSGVPLAFQNVSPTAVICRGQSANIGVSATGGRGAAFYTYSWSPATGLNNTNTPSVVASPTITTVYTVSVSDGNATIDTTITVTVNQLPVLNINPSAIAVCPGSPVTLTASGAQNYIWDNGVINGVSTVPGGTTTYHVTGTDANTCVDTAQITITVYPQPAVQANASTSAVCEGGNVTLFGSGASTYTWNNGVTNNVPFVASITNTYTVTGIDANNCTNTSQITITVYDLPVVDINTFTNITCFGLNNGTAIVTATGTGPFAYAWSNNPNGANTNTASSMLPGIWYVVTVTDNNSCVNMDSVLLTQPLLLTQSNSQTDPTCGQNNGTATVTISGGTIPYTYNWQDQPLENTNSIDSLAAGTYNVTITDANNCTINTSIILNAIPGINAALNITDVSCYGLTDGIASVNYTGNYNFLWSNSSTNDSITGLSAGTIVSVIVSDINGCNVVLNDTIMQPQQLALTFTTTNAKCYGGVGSIATQVNGGVSPYSHTWNTGSSNSTLFGFAGIYTDTLKDANGCFVIGKDTIIQPDSALKATISVTNAKCYGENSGSVSAVGRGGTWPYTYIWSSNDGTQLSSTNNLGVGKYRVTVVDFNNCKYLDTAVITQPTEIILDTTLVTNVTCEEGDDGIIRIHASGGIAPYTYFWFSRPDQQNYVAYGFKHGDQDVKVTDNTGCAKVFTINVPNTNIPCLDIPSVFTPNEDSNHDLWKIKNLHLYPQAKIEVYNRWGSILFQADGKEYSNKPWDGKYNGNDVPNGSYLYIIDLGNGILKKGTLTILR